MYDTETSFDLYSAGLHFFTWKSERFMYPEWQF
jgi:hypothetical protein